MMKFIICLFVLLIQSVTASPMYSRYSPMHSNTQIDETEFDFCEANSDGIMLYYHYIEDVFCELVAGPEKYSGVINIPEYVTENQIPVIGVGAGAFYYCDDLIEVHVPNTALYLESISFYGNSHLTKVTLSENLLAIGELAFEYCWELSSINIPQSLEYVGYFAFSHCTKTGPLYNDKYFFYYPMLNYDDYGQSYSIPEGIEVISTSAFSFANLDEVIIPNTVHTIMENAFDGSEITHITIPSSVKTIMRKAFGQTRLSEVIVPTTVQEMDTEVFDSCLSLKKATLLNPLEEIPYGTFHTCTELEEVSFPNTVHKIGAHAFSNNMKLLSFDFSNIDTIEEGAFYRCESLTEVNLSGSITNIPKNAFNLCERIEKISLPKTLKQIGELAFYQNTSLTSLDIPDSVTRVSSNAFWNCKNLREIRLGKNLRFIGFGAFSQLEHIKAIDIPQSVQTIENMAFAYSWELKDVTVHWETPLPIQFDIFDNEQYSREMTLHVPAGTKDSYASANGWGKFSAIVEDASSLSISATKSDNKPKVTKKLLGGKFIIENGKLNHNLQGQIIVR